jgi:hypothetical protein
MDRDQTRLMRRREATEVRARLDTAEKAVASLQSSIGVWADIVRGSVLLRHTSDDSLDSRALITVRAIERAAAELAAAKREFLLAEPRVRLREAAPEPGEDGGAW